MRRALRAALALCAASLLAVPAQAATVIFSGNITSEIGAGTFDPGQAVLLAVSWTPGAGAAAVTSAVLTVNGQTWTSFNPGTVSVETTGGFSRLRVQLPSGFTGGSAPGGFSLTGLDFNVRAAGDLSLAANATQANWDAIYFSSLTVANPASGLFVADGAAYQFEGAAIPEPASMALLGGLSLVAAGGAWRRRRQSTTTVA